ncbi:MAG TPA: His-Xaa-Ser system radical SAM maturase HxsB [Puia sp.]|jgi:His-Xaa-Ser system radical SAM maturase HxsB
MAETVKDTGAVARQTRKFREQAYFDQQKDGAYFLLPFKFHRLDAQRELLVNEVGDFLIVPDGTTARIVRRKLKKQDDSELYGDLVANFFISETGIPRLIDVYATRYRTKKSFLEGFTSLHIFVISLRCEHTCHYCQVSRVTSDKEAFDMSIAHIDRGIEWMFRSPNAFLTMEFQGGEALLAFDRIKYAVGKVATLAPAYGKHVSFVICTNLALITDDILQFCQKYSILISTSIDGPDFLHNANRHRPGSNSHELAVNGIRQVRKVLGQDRVSALMTTTTRSLCHPTEIVEEYFNLGFRNIFLRPISPYGFATRNEKKNGYDVQTFLAFYKIALDRILAYNQSGIFFSEDYATILLRKMLTPFPVGYVDLNSPTGAITGVLVFNYNGAVYATDESRMLAEMNDFTFQLGHLDKNSYDEVVYGDKARDIVEAGVNESLPGCADCAFQPYCGGDPVHHYATQGDMIGYRPTSTFCERNMEIIRYLFELMDSDPQVKLIFESWIKPRR